MDALKTAEHLMIHIIDFMKKEEIQYIVNITEKNELHSIYSICIY